MKKEFNVKGFNVKSFMVSGLTSKWGIGSPRDERYKEPLHAWTINGRADGSTNFTTLSDISGNRVGMTLSGFTGTAGSGFENGYLVFDGVKDYALTAPITIEKDWTVVGEWKFLPTVLGSAGLSKPSSFFMYNDVSGTITTFVNAGSGAFYVKEVGINAVCSDGRIYGKTWNEYLNNKPQTVTSSNGTLMIGRNGAKYTSMKFKNLAIYDRVLSEAQCKKAYDWLQTQ